VPKPPAKKPVPPPAPKPVPKPPASKPPPKTFAVGCKVKITASDVNCRSSPGTSASVLSVWYENDTTKITAGPKKANGYTWWKTSKNCWSVEEFLKVI